MRLFNKLEQLFFYGAWHGVKSTIAALRYFFVRDVLHRPLIRRSLFNYDLLLATDDPGISKELAIFGQREMEYRVMLTEVVKPGMTIWDLGANIGYYAIMEAMIVGPAGHVYAVEPSPSNVTLLRKNISLNGLADRIDVEAVGISNRDGEADFFLSTMSNVNTFHPTTRDGARAAHLTGTTIRVPIVDVPTFLVGKRPVDLVRMDIEGHEVEVFDGIIRAVRAGTFSAKILFEVHFQKYDDREHNMRVQLEGLFALGYRPTIMASTDERKTFFGRRGYLPERLVRTDGVTRGLYRNVSCADATWFLCEVGGVRTVLLEKGV